MIHNSSYCEKNPTQIWIEPTSRCNTRCIHCIHFYKQFGEDIDTKVYIKIRDQVLNNAKQVQLIGLGEPFLSKHFWEIFSDCSERKIEIYTCSNGILLQNDEYVSKLVRNRVILTLSIDGTRKETFEFVRPYIKWETVIKALKCIQKNRLLLNSKNKFRLRFNFCAMKKNIQDLPHLVRLAHKFGADEIIVLPLSGEDCMENVKQQSLHNSMDEIYTIFNRSLRLSNRYGIKLNIPRSFHNLILKKEVHLSEKINYYRYRAISSIIKLKNLGLKSSLNLLNNKIRQKTSYRKWYPQSLYSKIFSNYCSLPWNATYFSSDGKVFPCCILQQQLGHIKHQEWNEIWNSQPYCNLRKTIHSWNPSKGCRYCGLPSGINGGDEKAYDKFFEKFDVTDIPLNSSTISFDSGFYQIEYSGSGKPSHIWMKKQGNFRIFELKKNAKFLRIIISSLEEHYKLNPGYCKINNDLIEPFDNTFNHINFPINNINSSFINVHLEMENLFIIENNYRKLSLAICGIQILSI